MTRVSVVMPVYNANAWIHEAVDSVLAQDHLDLEIILIDDGSTEPKTVALMENPPWPGVKVIRQSNTGQAAARNAGIAAATGDYILPVDADDYIAPTYVSQAARILDEQPETGIVYCRAEFMGDLTGPWELPPYSLKLMLTGGLIFVTSMFRKSDWSAAGGFDESLRRWEDHDFWLKIVGLDRGVHQIDEVLFKYRIRQGSVNSSYSRDDLVATYAQIMKNNSTLFIDNSDLLVATWFERTDKIDFYRDRYNRVQRLFTRYPRVSGLLRKVVRKIK